MAIPRTYSMWLLIVIVVLAILTVALWLDLRQQSPSFTIIDFHMPTETGSKNTEIWIKFDIKNPNKVYSITYDVIAVTVRYGKRTLGTDDTHLYHQKVNSEAELPFDVEADDHLRRAILKEISNSPAKKAKLMVEVETAMKYHNQGYTSRHSRLTYRGQFEIGSDGNIAGKKRVKLCKGSCK